MDVAPLPGRPLRLDVFFAEVYRELCRIAHTRCVAFGHPSLPLDTVALVHDAYLRLRGVPDVAWREGEHVKAVACRAIRQILLNHLRDRKAQKRGGGWPDRLNGEDVADPHAAPEHELIDWLAAMAALEAVSPRLCQVVEMRFCGYEVKEIAEVLGVGTATVVRDSKRAGHLVRAYLSPLR